MTAPHVSRQAHAVPRRKLRFAQIVEAIQRRRDAARASGEEHGEASGADALDRRVVLARLCAELEVEEELLLLRGFDRAYRLVIEGV